MTKRRTGAATTGESEQDWQYTFNVNAHGTGRLMYHCRNVKGFLHCSTSSIYKYQGRREVKESDPLGLHVHTYSLSKIAAEAVAKFASVQWSIPTTIARFSVPYGNNGGWPWFHLMMMNAGAPIPVHEDKPSVYNLIHEDDYMSMIPKLLEIADVPATTINWGGSEAEEERRKRRRDAAIVSRLRGARARIA